MAVQTQINEVWLNLVVRFLIRNFNSCVYFSIDCNEIYFNLYSEFKIWIVILGKYDPKRYIFTMVSYYGYLEMILGGISSSSRQLSNSVKKANMLQILTFKSLIRVQSDLVNPDDSQSEHIF